MGILSLYYQNEILRFLEVVSCVGATTTHISPEVGVTADDQAEMQKFTEGPAPYVVLHPGASDPRRRWPAERFATVAEHVLNSGYRVFVAGLKSETYLAEAVGAKTVGLYWCGNVINAGPMARSCHRPLLSWMVTGESHAKDDTSFVTDITVEECLAACESLLAT